MMLGQDIVLDRTYKDSYFQKRSVSQRVFDMFWLGTVMQVPGFLASRGILGSPAFPIHDINGDFAGWGFRPGSEDHKYYYYDAKVSDHMYGLCQALPHIIAQKEVIVVEGFFDVLLAHTAGFKNVVGAFSNCVSKNQAILLGSITNNVRLSMDSDSAGLDGTMRSEELLKKILPDMNVSKFLIYPHHDFCDYATEILNNAD